MLDSRPARSRVADFDRFLWEPSLPTPLCCSLLILWFVSNVTVTGWHLSWAPKAKVYFSYREIRSLLIYLWWSAAGIFINDCNWPHSDLIPVTNITREKTLTSICQTLLSFIEVSAIFGSFFLKTFGNKTGLRKKKHIYSYKNLIWLLI